MKRAPCVRPARGAACGGAAGADAALPLGSGFRPDWPAPATVVAYMTERGGGVSPAPWNTLNLGDHVGDAAAAVAENRRRLAATLGLRPVFLRQVHGCDVVRIDPDTTDGVSADAAVSTAAGVACTVLVADCLPVLLCTADGRVVGAAHAGWRGLAGTREGGVLEAVVKEIRALAGEKCGSHAIDSEANEIYAWLGPAIGPRAFEVGPEVRAAFCDADARAAAAFRPRASGVGERYLADLPALARLRLQALGVTRVFGNDGSDRWCTMTQSARFFSHRRDTPQLGASGRMAACIGRRPLSDS